MASTGITKTLLVMRFTAIILLVGSLQVTAKGFSQTTISLSKKDASLEEVLMEIGRQSGWKYFFADQLEQQAKPVTIEVSNVPLEQALDICFRDQPFSYEIFKKTIVIRQKKVGKTEENKAPTPAILPKITGIVRNEKKEPLVGASISIENSDRGTSTDNKGMFELANVPADAKIRVSYTGYQSKELSIQGKLYLELSLSLNGTLDQVQVIAYGTTTQRFNTGDISTVKSEDIEKQPVSNPLLALEGRAPGVFIAQSTGLPGSGVAIQIRGQNSLAYGNDPFYVIDGVPYTPQLLPNFGVILGTSGAGSYNYYGNPLSFINPSDIESISILKDAVATSIYGSRAGNGAILITTKKGSAGQTKVDINLQQGIGQVARKLDLMNTAQYLQMRHEAISNDGPSAQAPFYDVDGTWDTTRYTDWQKTLIGGTARYTNVSGTISGGNTTTQYLFGATYHRESSVFPGDFSDQKGAINVSINSISLNQKFHFQMMGNYSIDVNQLPQSDLTFQAMSLAPDAPPLYNKDGTLNWAQSMGSSTWQNPIAGDYNTYQNKTNNLLANAVVSYRILSGLELKSSFGYNKLLSNEFLADPLISYIPEYRPYIPRGSFFGENNINSWIIEPQASYNKTIGKGKLEALLGITFQQTNSSGLQLQAYGFSSDQLLGDILAAPSVFPKSATSAVYKYNAAFGRLNYNLLDKYILDISVRRDGSSRFGSANQFHNFGAAGVAWLFSQESFLKENLSFLSFGKVRASYGTTGNDQIGDYKFLNLYIPTYAQVAYQGVAGLQPNGLTNQYLEWEETKKMEFGMDLGFVRDKILINASYYQNRSSNQLLGYDLPIITGSPSVTRNFPATLQNSGWEITLNTVNYKGKDFEWDSHFNLTVPESKLIAFPNLATSAYATTFKIGQPLGVAHVFHFMGVDQATGLYEFADGKGGSTSSPDTIGDFLTGHSVTLNVFPKVYGGFENKLRYKGFELDILFQFAKQIGPNYYFGGFPAGFFSQNEPTYLLNRWQKSKNIATHQLYGTNLNIYFPFIDAQQSDAGYSDASYIRLKNLSLSWNLPGNWKAKAHLQNARLFIQGQNLLTITSYIGLDPETKSSTSLPPLRVVTMGFQLAF